MTRRATDTPESVSEVTDTTVADITYVASEVENTEAELVDRAGNAILELVNRAARTAEADLQAAREAAQKLSDQLRTAQSRISELDANVRYYQGRTERAEKWMKQISSEIQRLLVPDDIDGARRMAERLQNQDMTGAMPRQREASFLRRLSRN
jgi:chromosome segregation ATPase